ncbi:hypothetical protein [Vulcanisaeta thermophila]|uniref:hypothetical protein n=1 Tax=Vulcanisaeta thermophila TaxID=867917 RepID=UPI000853B383|nr:hypothetical protein [Vulcanisaeta thermophila]
MGLKEDILRLLREDEEFRLAVAGLLGLDSILNELRKLREDFNRFVETENRRWEAWYETWKRFLEDYEKRWRENEKRWEENQKRWEENEKRWREEEERWKAWFETWKKFLEDYEIRWKENEERWEEANKRFSRIELELGALSESVYSRYVWEDLREEFGARGEAVIERVRNARVDNVDIDLLVITNRAAYVVEVKVKPRITDVGALLAKADLVRKKFGKDVVPMLVGVYVSGDVEEYAVSKGVRVLKY